MPTFLINSSYLNYFVFSTFLYRVYHNKQLYIVSDSSQQKEECWDKEWNWSGLRPVMWKTSNNFSNREIITY